MGNPPNKGRVTVVEEEKQSRTNSQSGRRPGLGLRFVQAAEEWFTRPLTCLKLKSHVNRAGHVRGGRHPDDRRCPVPAVGSARPPGASETAGRGCGHPACRHPDLVTFSKRPLHACHLIGADLPAFPMKLKILLFL